MGLRDKVYAPLQIARGAIAFKLITSAAARPRLLLSLLSSLAKFPSYHLVIITARISARCHKGGAVEPSPNKRYLALVLPSSSLRSTAARQPAHVPFSLCRGIIITGRVLENKYRSRWSTPCFECVSPQPSCGGVASFSCLCTELLGKRVSIWTVRAESKANPLNVGESSLFNALSQQNTN